jgi:cellulose synthase/poly-beta-1,6-N-acetylglucosamine synthase-like glycosyltransferase
LIQHTVEIEYPKDLLEIQILDDSTDETKSLLDSLCSQYRAQGFDIKVIRRENRLGFKAGALSEGLKVARGEFLAIFDADFLPTKHFLKKTIPYFANPEISMVQTRWSHLNSLFSLLTRAQSVLLDGHFQIEHTARHRSGFYFNFNGTAGIWRKSAIDNAGGWQGDTLTEDLDLSYRAQLAGSKFVYLCDVSIPAELPIEIDAFKSQQHRWTKGSVQVFRKLFFDIMSAPIRRDIKLEALLHLGANFCYPMLLMLGLLILPCLYVSHSSEPLDQITSGTPLLIVLYKLVFLSAFLSLFVFYGTAVIETKSLSRKSLWYTLPLALVMGIGLSVNNSLAVFEALIGHRSDFNRTPKTGATNGPRSKGCAAKKVFRWRAWSHWLECFLAIYFLGTLYFAAIIGRWEAIPFISLYFFGFAIFAVMGTRFSLAKPILRLREQRSLLAR